MNTSQKAIAAARVTILTDEPVAEICVKYGISERVVRSARKLLLKATPADIKAIENGTKSIHAVEASLGISEMLVDKPVEKEVLPADWVDYPDYDYLAPLKVANEVVAAGVVLLKEYMDGIEVVEACGVHRAWVKNLFKIRFPEVPVRKWGAFYLNLRKRPSLPLEQVHYDHVEKMMNMLGDISLEDLLEVNVWFESYMFVRALEQLPNVWEQPKSKPKFTTLGFGKKQSRWNY
jgi:hypothetical protein